VLCVDVKVEAELSLVRLLVGLAEDTVDPLVITELVENELANVVAVLVDKVEPLTVETVDPDAVVAEVVELDKFSIIVVPLEVEPV
jgi:hypothetical protein